MTFEINTLVPEVWCSNFDVSMQFYSTYLGFEVAQRRGGDPHAYLTLHGAQIMLAHWHLDGTWAPWHAADLDHPFGRGINFQFMVPDVDGLYRAILSHGIKPLLEIYDAEIWKTDVMDTRRQFMVSDPDGYVLRFAQSLTTRPVEADDHKRLDAQYGLGAP
ncbi:MAG: VOC family protein [Pseudomonadota bacterium]